MYFFMRFLSVARLRERIFLCLPKAAEGKAKNMIGQLMSVANNLRLGSWLVVKSTDGRR